MRTRATSRSCIPARTSLDHLEDALDAAGIPYRAESSSLVYQASEVRDLLAAAAGSRRPERPVLVRHRAALAARSAAATTTCGPGSTAAASFNILARSTEDRSSASPVAARARLPAAPALPSRGG